MSRSKQREARLLLTVPPPRQGDLPSLPPQARRLVAAVRRGRGHAFFPPVARGGPEGVVMVERYLQGEEDARRVGALLARPGFRPLVELLEVLGGWCRSTARQHPELLGPRVLTVTNAELFGPLVSEAFTLCAAAGEGPPHPGVRTLLEGFQAFFALFLSRLARDVRAGVFRREGFSGPVVGLWANPDETHNGRQHVLRLRFRQGGAVAYKPRPAGGEALFLAEGRDGAARSLFDRLNRLSAQSGAGTVRLPTLRVLEGRGPDRFAYSWQEWIPRPRQWGTLRESERLRLQGCRLAPRDAERFWHRAGSLSAACFAFGIADLFEGNVLVGARKGERQPLPYPVDLEFFFAPLGHLDETGLVEDVRGGGNHHVGFERLPRWCTTGGPMACFFPSGNGGLQLRRRTRPWGREETRSVVADTEGNFGFGAYLLSYLRGMFDLWSLLLLERPKVARWLQRASAGRFVRVLPKPTVVYGDVLDEMVLSPGAPPRGSGQIRLSREEREQLLRFDVPYFFRSAGGGPLLALKPPPVAAGWKRAGPQQLFQAIAPPSKDAVSGARITVLGLGVAVRDAVAYVFPDIRDRAAEDSRRGVRIALRDAQRGSVSFDWGEVDKRLTFTWNRRELRVSLDPLEAGPPA